MVSYTSTTAAQYNPFRYRGYYYDTDLGMYYLQSRYYDPAAARFINVDTYASTGQGFTGNNMFAYCNNNPVMNIDPDGDVPWLALIILGVCGVAGGIIAYNMDDSDEENTSKSNTERIVKKIKNAATGFAVGVAIGGTGLILFGTGAALSSGSAFTTIELLKMNAFQTVSLGMLAYDILPIIVAPFYGLDMASLGWEN